MSSDFWAGYLSGAASIVIGNPLDLIKVRLQAGHTSASNAGPKGARSLLAGLPAPVLTYGALNALLYTFYNRTLALVPPLNAAQGFRENSGSDRLAYPAWGHFSAGVVAGFATFILSAPTEYVKCRAQVAESSISGRERPNLTQQKTSWSIARETLRHQGIRGLYVGGAVTSLRDAIGYGFYFLTYEMCRAAWERNVTHKIDEPSQSAWKNVASGDATGILLCGGLAGVATWTSIFPLDVIKTRLQTQHMGSISADVSTAQAQAAAETTARTPLLRRSSEAPTYPQGQNANATPLRYKGAWLIAKEAYAQEGLQVFWRGIGVCCLRAFVVNAVQWAVYEWVMQSTKPS